MKNLTLLNFRARGKEFHLYLQFDYQHWFVGFWWAKTFPLFPGDSLWAAVTVYPLPCFSIIFKAYWTPK